MPLTLASDKITFNDMTSLSSATPRLNVVNSPTIDLSYNSSTGVLSADVKNDSIRYSQLASWQTLSGSPTLSAEAVQPRLAKAWIYFDWYTPIVIRNSFNISSITDVQSTAGQGTFRANFITSMPNNFYVLNMTCSDDSYSAQGGLFATEVNTATFSRTVNSFFGNTNQGTNAGIGLTRVSVLVHGN